MYTSRMLFEECVRTVQLEGGLQAAKFDMMARRPLSGGWTSRSLLYRNQNLQCPHVIRERKAEVCKETIISS
jgi:hypothetical protein